MASQAELNRQLLATDNALAVLRQQLATAQPGSAGQTQLSIAIFQLQQQQRNIERQISTLTQATNPPNPQVSDPPAVPPPPPLTGSPITVNNPPDPQAPAVDATQTTPIVEVSTPNAVSDDATPLSQRDILATDEDVTFIETPGGLNILPNEVQAFDIETDPQDGLIEFVAGGQRIVDTENPEFIIDQGGLRLTADDVPVTEIEENGTLVEFTQSGERIVDADNPEFVVTDGGLRVLPEDIESNDDPIEGGLREPTDADVEEAVRAQALLDQARQQASVSELRKANGTAVGDGDWRVRLRLAPYANYLYKSPEGAGIMEPLRETDGVVFPYTPRIDMTYSADYNPYDLTHSNYRGYFYKGSKVGEIVLNAMFTAQDSFEADYLLAAVHFFRSCTKMFYGQDDNRGAPPPMVFLTGLGEFQFNEHPCVISQFNYNLPDDVDYIRARGRQSTSAGVTQGGNGLMWRRTLTGSPAASYSLSSIWARLTGANLPQGGMNIPPPPPNLGTNSPTYMPTKINISLTLLPMPTRSQVSQQFSLEKYANGNLLKGGFW